MEVTYAAKAIVLKTEPWNDVDSRVSFLTQQQGRLDLIARGTKKLSSKLAGHLQPGNLVDLMVINGRQIAYAGAASSLECYPAIKQDLDKLAAAQEVLVTSERLLRVSQPEEAIFELLRDFFTILDKIQSEPIFYDFLAQGTLLQALGHLGYQPDITMFPSGGSLTAVWGVPTKNWSAACWRNLQLITNYDLAAAIKQMSLQRASLKETTAALRNLLQVTLADLG